MAKVSQPPPTHYGFARPSPPSRLRRFVAWTVVFIVIVAIAFPSAIQLNDNARRVFVPVYSICASIVTSRP